MKHLKCVEGIKGVCKAVCKHQVQSEPELSSPYLSRLDVYQTDAELFTGASAKTPSGSSSVVLKILTKKQSGLKIISRDDIQWVGYETASKCSDWLILRVRGCVL